MALAATSEDWTNGITIARMAATLTPKRAARIKYRALLFQSMDPEGAKHIDRILENDPGHRWFCFCLDAVARQEVTLWTTRRP